MRKQTRKKNKQINNKKKTKAKGQTRNLRETKFLIKNISFNDKNIPPDVAKKITSNYLSNIVVTRVHQYNRRNLIIEKLKNYINIVAEIQMLYSEEDLDDVYYHINNKKVLNNLLKDIKKKAKKDVTESYMDSVEEKLVDYYREIKEVFETEIERAEYGDNKLLYELDRFLQSN